MLPRAMQQAGLGLHGVEAGLVQGALGAEQVGEIGQSGLVALQGQAVSLLGLLYRLLGGGEVEAGFFGPPLGFLDLQVRFAGGVADAGHRRPA